MHTRLNELRNQISLIDHEIVAALAQRSRFCSPIRPCPTSPAAAPAAGTDPELAARVLADYARVVPGTLRLSEARIDDRKASEAADCAVVGAVHRRMRVSLEIARAKVAGTTPQLHALVAAGDAAGIEQAITQPAVEEQVIARALTAARELPTENLPANFPDRIAAIYRTWILPFSRRVQVEALLASK